MRHLRLVTTLVVLAAMGAAAIAGAVSSADAPRPAARIAAAGCTPPAAGTRRITVQSDRVPVVLHVPPGLRAGRPIVLALPGAAQTARDFADYTALSRVSDRMGVAVAYATAAGSRPFWNITDHVPGKPQDVPYLRAVISAIVRATCADADRVGVTGVSNGGGMSARMACDAADLVAAAAPVAGGYGALPDCHPSRAVPILEIHGTADEVVPYAGRGNPVRGDVASFLAQWRTLNGCTGTPAERPVAPGVTELRSTTCAAGVQVVHDRVEGQRHGWPGEDDLGLPFSASMRTMRFLTAFRR